MGCGVVRLLFLSALKFAFSFVLGGGVTAAGKSLETRKMLQTQSTSQLNHVLDPLISIVACLLNESFLSY